MFGTAHETNVQVDRIETLPLGQLKVEKAAVPVGVAFPTNGGHAGCFQFRAASNASGLM